MIFKSLSETGSNIRVFNDHHLTSGEGSDNDRINAASRSAAPMHVAQDFSGEFARLSRFVSQ